MLNFCGIFSSNEDSYDEVLFEKSLNLVGTNITESVRIEEFFASVSFPGESSDEGSNLYEDQDMIILLGGDVIGFKNLPWEDIANNFQKENYSWFSSLRGLFSIAIYDKGNSSITLISDQNSQFPLYYGYLDGCFVFSTNLSTFTTLKVNSEFNREWLYEFLFFNFPIDRTTFLKNVHKIRPVTILTFQIDSKKIKEISYADLHIKPEKVLVGKMALDKCVEIFRNRVADYYSVSQPNIVAISGGFDSRTILSLAPEQSKIELYTYGTRNSHDLRSVSKFVRKLGHNHSEIYFDDDFLVKLPNLIYETVRLSGGTQPILRSTLIYVYSKLYEIYNAPLVLLGGINGDFYRGWDFYNTNYSILSAPLKEFFRTGKVMLDENLFKKILSKRYSEFIEYIRKSLNKIQNLYGDPRSPEAKMSYITYQANPRYFGGEIAIAGNYFKIRQPFLDYDLVRLAFETEFSELGQRERFINGKDQSFIKFRMLSKLIKSNSKLKSTYINGMPIALYALGNKPLFKVSRPFIRGFDYIFNGYRAPKEDLENWEYWFGTTLKNEFDKYLNESSLILNYIDKEFMFSVKESGEMQLLNKLVTTEILLNLIRNGWDL